MVWMKTASHSGISQKSGKPFCGMGGRFNPESTSKYLFGYILSDLMRKFDFRPSPLYYINT